MVFEILLNNVIPLYGLIALGYVIGRYMKLDVDPIATIMLYAIVPIVMFGATANMNFTSEFIVPPLMIASISIVASVTFYALSGLVWGADDKRHNLLGFLGVSSNATYFGVPIAVAIAVAGQQALDQYMIMVLPLFLLDCTLAYYFAVRGDFSAKESLRRVAKLPIIYGAIGGLAFNAAGFEFTDLMLDYWSRFTGTMIILGMMMIGAALAGIKEFRFDWEFFGGVLLMRYVMWPVLGLLWIWADITHLQMLDSTTHLFIILICACPLAANTVAYTAKLNLLPALTACMVMVTTVLALGFIPLMTWVKDVLF